LAKKSLRQKKKDDRPIEHKYNATIFHGEKKLSIDAYLTKQ
jgi:hypothetical protein